MNIPLGTHDQAGGKAGRRAGSSPAPCLCARCRYGPRSGAFQTVLGYRSWGGRRCNLMFLLSTGFLGVGTTGENFMLKYIKKRNMSFSFIQLWDDLNTVLQIINRLNTSEAVNLCPGWIASLLKNLLSIAERALWSHLSVTLPPYITVPASWRRASHGTVTYSLISWCSTHIQACQVGSYHSLYKQIVLSHVFNVEGR